jgi:hypothetical protein
MFIVLTKSINCAFFGFGASTRRCETPDASRLYELTDDVARRGFSISMGRTMRLSELPEAHRIAESGGIGEELSWFPEANRHDFTVARKAFYLSENTAIGRLLTADHTVG